MAPSESWLGVVVEAGRTGAELRGQYSELGSRAHRSITFCNGKEKICVPIGQIQAVSV